MTTGSFSTSAGAIQAGAQATRQAREEIDSSINKVDQAVQNVGAGWQGSGGTAMRKTADEWLTSARKISAELDLFEADLQATDAGYVAAEEEQSAAFTNAMTRLQA